MTYVIKWNLVGNSNTGYVLMKSTEQIEGDVLSELQRLVDGRIEVITYLDGAALLMNEEALVNGMPAWAVHKEHELYKFVPEHFTVNGDKVLVGPVVLCSDNGVKFSGFNGPKTIEGII